MDIQELMARLLTATPEQRAAIEAVFNGAAEKPRDTRLLRMTEACKALNVSRTTLWTLTRSGRLPVVKLGGGSLRVPAWAIMAFTEQAAQVSFPPKSDGGARK